MKQIKGYLRKYEIMTGMILVLFGVNSLLLWLIDAERFLVIAGLYSVLSVLVLLVGIMWSEYRERKKLRIWNELLHTSKDERNMKHLPNMTLGEEEQWMDTLNCLEELETQLLLQKQKTEELEEYVENWVHEIKIPLSLLELLLDNRKEDLSPYVYQRLLYINQQIQQQVNQMLYYARLKSVHKDYVFCKTALCEICQECLERFIPIMLESRIEIQDATTNREVVTDRKGVAFILGQFLSNSLKYRDQNKEGSWIRISEEIREEEQVIVLVLEDNGIGIRKEDIPFIFDKGYTGDTQINHAKATGMGLYLAKQMANELGITIVAESNKGVGTRMELKFPIV